MQFAVLSRAPIEVVDPDTNVKLGEVDRPKVRVRAAHVYPEYSIAETFEVYEVRTGGIGIDPSVFSSILSPPGVQRRIRTLRIKDADVPPPLPPEESFVKVGDRVVQILDEGKD